MATKPLVPVEEYLRTKFDGPDPEYLDGELVERNLGDDSHGAAESNLVRILHPLKKKFRIHVRPRCTCDWRRLASAWQILPFSWKGRRNEIPSSPPHVVMEIVSPGDRYVEIHDKLAEYRGWGIKHIWLADPASRTFSVYDEAGLREVPVLELPEFELRTAKSEIFE